jgi:hypothetical protein
MKICHSIAPRNWRGVAYLNIFAILFWSAGPARPQQPAANAAPSTVTRACSVNPVLGPGGKKKSAPKTKHPLPPEPLPACMEMKGEPLEIQEALQALVRDLQWRVHENHVSEDTWTFVRYMDADDLEKYADTKVLIEPVNFEDGKAAVLVRTTDAGAGFARVQISAQFEGEGKSSDATLQQPATSWPLVSKGTLEKELLTALAAHYQHVE